MDYVYQNCWRGLRDNIRFLYRMFNVFRCSGYDVVIAEKAYNYDLQAYKPMLGMMLRRI